MRPAEIDRQQMIKDFSKGMKIYEIMKKHRCGYSKAAGILHRAFGKENMRFRKYDKNKIIKDFHQGYAIREIAKRNNVKSTNSLYKILYAAGLRKRKKNAIIRDLKEWKSGTYEDASPFPEDWNVLPKKFSYRMLR